MRFASGFLDRMEGKGQVALMQTTVCRNNRLARSEVTKLSLTLHHAFRYRYPITQANGFFAMALKSIVSPPVRQLRLPAQSISCVRERALLGPNSA
jgi:hypothetical protein